MNNYRLLAALRRHLTLLLPLATPALLLNLALLVLGLAQSPNCHLSTLATVLPLDARRDNLIQRLRRWLKTPALSWERYYRPLVTQFLANWPGVELALVMDRTDLNDRVSLLFVGIATNQRVVLLAWEVLPWQHGCRHAVGPAQTHPATAARSHPGPDHLLWRCGVSGGGTATVLSGAPVALARGGQT